LTNGIGTATIAGKFDKKQEGPLLPNEGQEGTMRRFIGADKSFELRCSEMCEAEAIPEMNH
jgi:hypothetical protein